MQCHASSKAKSSERMLVWLTQASSRTKSFMLVWRRFNKCSTNSSSSSATELVHNEVGAQELHLESHHPRGTRTKTRRVLQHVHRRSQVQ
eukprot:1157443-Amphidinium_carterae.1